MRVAKPIQYGASVTIMVLVSLTSLPDVGLGMTRPRSKATWNQSSKQSDVVDEVREPSDPHDRALRRTKNKRYNTGGADLTARDGQLRQQEERERFVEHYWLRDQSLFPASEADIVILGTLVRAQPYLSTDRSSIYTELTIRVEEVIKSYPQTAAAVNANLVIDRLGGALRLASQQIVRLDLPNQGPGRLRDGERYVLFAKNTHEGLDLEMLTGFELRASQVYGLVSDGGVSFRSRRGVPENLAQEEPFLEAMRKAVKLSGR